MTKKNIMEEFELEEISGVDFPAQAHAKVTILKSAYSSTESDKGYDMEETDKVLLSPGDDESREDFVTRFMGNEEMVREFPEQEQRAAVANQQYRAARAEKNLALLAPTNGHTHLIDITQEGGRTSHDYATDDEEGHHHPWLRSSDGSVSIGMAAGHTHQMTQIESDAAGSDAGSEGLSEEKTMTNQTEAVSEQAVDEQLDALKAELLLAKAYGQLTDAQKAYASELPEGEERDAFVTKSEDERQRLVEKAQEADPVSYTCIDGTEIRKSAGELVIRLAKQADEATRELAVEKAARANEQLAKRAESELDNLPGDEVAKVALLKAVDSIDDEAVRTAVAGILKAANERGSAAFQTLGTAAKSAKAVDAEAQLAELVSKRAEETGESNDKALFAVLSTAEGRSLYAQTR